MRKYFVIASILILFTVGIVVSQQHKVLRVSLSGYEEVPALSTTGTGSFMAMIAPGDMSVQYELTYDSLEGDVTQAHIHFGNAGTNGGVAVFICSNLGNGPAGTPPCPTPPATVTGTFTAADVVGPAGQGIAAGELDELLRAVRAGSTYINVHSTLYPGGEIRSKIDVNDHRR
jgi:hypothetical protein